MAEHSRARPTSFKKDSFSAEFLSGGQALPDTSAMSTYFEEGELRVNTSVINSPVLQDFMRQRGITLSHDDAKPGRVTTPLPAAKCVPISDDHLSVLSGGGDYMDLLSDISPESLALLHDEEDEDELEFAPPSRVRTAIARAKQVTAEVRSTPTYFGAPTATSKSGTALYRFCPGCAYRFQREERFCPDCGTKRASFVPGE